MPSAPLHPGQVHLRKLVRQPLHLLCRKRQQGGPRVATIDATQAHGGFDGWHDAKLADDQDDTIDLVI